MSVVDTFRTLLAERLGSRGFTVSMWNDGTRMSNRLLAVSALPAHLHAKGSRSSSWLAMLTPGMDPIAPGCGGAGNDFSTYGPRAALMDRKSHDCVTSASNSIGELSSTSQSTVLYVKVSTRLPGTWCLTPNQLDRLAASRVRCFFVLLYQSASVGYLLPEDQILTRVNDGSLTRLHDGSYIVNQRAEFMSSQRFESIDALVSRAF